MDIYQSYRLQKNQQNSFFNNNSAIDNYILARIQMRDNSQRIIFDPEDYDKALEAATADLARRIQRYFQ